MTSLKLVLDEGQLWLRVLVIDGSSLELNNKGRGLWTWTINLLHMHVCNFITSIFPSTFCLYDINLGKILFIIKDNMYQIILWMFIQINNPSSSTSFPLEIDIKV
jgi:hypothetical protein